MWEVEAWLLRSKYVTKDNFLSYYFDLHENCKSGNAFIAPDYSTYVVIH